MTAVMLQVRLGSTRLPGKALLPLAGEKTVLDLVLEALLDVKADRYILLTDHESVTSLTPPALQHGFDIFEGPKDDVLSRYALAVRKYSPATIVRATGDNPLVSAELANMLLEKVQTSRDRLDYAAFTGPPIGTGVEVVDAESLLTADREAKDSYSREHVCPYLYNNPGKFSIQRFNAPDQFCAPGASVTIDTPEDYQTVSSIVASLYRGTPIPAQRLVSFLKTYDYTGTSTDGIS